MKLTEHASRIAMLLSTRGMGHTSLMQEGLNNFRGDALVIGLNTMQARSICHFRAQTRDMYRTMHLGYECMERSYGMRAAVAMDHAAIAELLTRLVRRIEVLEATRCYQQ